MTIESEAKQRLIDEHGAIAAQCNECHLDTLLLNDSKINKNLKRIDPNMKKITFQYCVQHGEDSYDETE